MVEMDTMRTEDWHFNHFPVDENRAEDYGEEARIFYFNRDGNVMPQVDRFTENDQELKDIIDEVEEAIGTDVYDQDGGFIADDPDFIKSVCYELVRRGFRYDKEFTGPPKKEVVWLFVHFPYVGERFLMKNGACVFHFSPKDEPDYREHHWDGYDVWLDRAMEEACKEAGTESYEPYENFFIVGAEFEQAVHDALVKRGVRYAPKVLAFYSEMSTG